jgi:CBS domain-containing protein
MSTIRQILLLKGSQVWSVGPHTSVYDALRIMEVKDVGALLVMEGDSLIGIISERDYARKVILQGKSSRETQVDEIMTGKLISIHPDQTVQECMELMNSHHIRHLPVVENGEVMGVISVRDVLQDIIYIQRTRIRSLEERLTEKP